MVRSILAVVTGIVTWMVAATLINFMLRALLPVIWPRSPP